MIARDSSFLMPKTSALKAKMLVLVRAFIIERVDSDLVFVCLDLFGGGVSLEVYLLVNLS